jgi:tetratricopeptide (TPR) repeat protein
MKDYDRAIADLTEAIRLDPKITEVLQFRGNAYFGKRDYDRAIADLSEAIRLDSKLHVNAFRLRGMVYGAKGDQVRSVADLSEAIRLNTNDPSPISSVGTRIWN